jgi:hypothetical protein
MDKNGRRQRNDRRQDHLDIVLDRRQGLERRSQKDRRIGTERRSPAGFRAIVGLDRRKSGTLK